MPNFPFQRAKPLGWAMFEAFASSQANQLDQNAAQAADGLAWTDVAAFRNWSPARTAANSGNALFYNSRADVWVNIGTNGGVPQASVMLGASGPFTALALPGGSPSGLTCRKRAADYNPAANVGLAGGLPSASSNRKYVRFPTAFTSTMATTVSSQTSTAGVACLKWVPWLGLWVAGLDGTGVVETSPDALTFTARTTPNANPRGAMAISSSSIVITSSAQTNKILQSNNGVAWFERTMPSTQAWINVVYLPLLGKFLAIGETSPGTGMGAIATSPDGETWTNQAFTLPTDIGTLDLGSDPMAVAFDRTVLCLVDLGFISGMAMIYSQDAGASWKYAAGIFPSPTTGALATNGKQLIYADGTSYYTTLGVGF